MRDKVTERFREQFGDEPAGIAYAPGRVNLIGEHTDYNDGFVLPMAIDRAIWIAFRPRQDRQVIITALDVGQTKTFDLDALNRSETGWVAYVQGVAWALQEAGWQPAGWEGVMAGNVPLGAGLSSSAALELAVARTFIAPDQPWDPARMARLCQRAENDWVGMNCGIMDQMISACAQTGQALLIDCRSLATTWVPLPAGTAVVVLDTATRRGLVDSAYNERRAQCEAAARFFGVPALRDVTETTFRARAGQLDPVIRRRARHIITENGRTLAAVEAMQQEDARLLGQLMNASHTSLRDDFEVSRDELNVMVELAQDQPACYGARLTGAGFGGCAVALVDAAHSDLFLATVLVGYEEQTGLEPAGYLCHPSAGAMLLSP